jgi:hypothetical protein
MIASDDSGPVPHSVYAADLDYQDTDSDVMEVEPREYTAEEADATEDAYKEQGS